MKTFVWEKITVYFNLVNAPHLHKIMVMIWMMWWFLMKGEAAGMKPLKNTESTIIVKWQFFFQPLPIKTRVSTYLLCISEGWDLF